jgi:hypothetical protein
MAILFVLLAISAVAIVAAIRAVATDGYHRTPVRISTEESTWTSH